MYIHLDSRKYEGGLEWKWRGLDLWMTHFCLVLKIGEYTNFLCLSVVSFLCRVPNVSSCLSCSCLCWIQKSQVSFQVWHIYTVLSILLNYTIYEHTLWGGTFKMWPFGVRFQQVILTDTKTVIMWNRSSLSEGSWGGDAALTFPSGCTVHRTTWQNKTKRNHTDNLATRGVLYVQEMAI